MLIRQFLQWTATAPAEARAEGVAALARAFAAHELEPAEAADAVAVMTHLLDDPAPGVRLALARELAASPDTPAAIVTALAGDTPEIAVLVLGHSPVLTVPELVDAAAVGDDAIQAAIARRPDVGAGLAAALAEVAGLGACTALCRNPTAEILDRSLARMIERFGHDASFRDLLGARRHLAPALRHDLASHTARQLQAFVTARGWLSTDRAARMTRDAVDGAVVIIGDEAAGTEGAPGVQALVGHLRRSGCLTPALILRAALTGESGLAEAAVGELAGVPLERVAGLLRNGSIVAFEALYGKAGLPAALREAFAAALRHAGRAGGSGIGERRQRIGRVLASVQGRADLAPVAALLRRLDAEAARRQARLMAQAMSSEAQPLLLHLAPVERRLPLPNAA